MFLQRKVTAIVRVCIIDSFQFLTLSRSSVLTQRAEEIYFDCPAGCIQDLWRTRKPPTALHLADPQLAAVAKQLDGSSSQADGAVPVSACRTTGLTDQHKNWSLQENTQVGLSKSTAVAMDLPAANFCIVRAITQHHSSVLLSVLILSYQHISPIKVQSQQHFKQAISSCKQYRIGSKCQCSTTAGFCFKAASLGTSHLTVHGCVAHCAMPNSCCFRPAVLRVQIFLKAIQLFLQNRSQDVGAAVFDKDDDLAVEFVTAAANLRSIAYNIPTQSLFAAKVEHKSKASSVQTF